MAGIQPACCPQPLVWPVQQGLFANQAGTGQGMEEQMAAIMNSPVMQSMLDNPELLRTMLQANPGIQQVT